MTRELETLYENILEGDMASTPGDVQTAIDSGVAPEVVLKEGMISAMTEVGRLFEEGDYFVPEMLVSARAMQAGLTVLRPYLVESGVEPIGIVVIGTVQGDMHDIGKNLVSMMLGGAGFKVIDLGVNIKPETFIEAVRVHAPQVVGLSALLTTTMPKMKDTIITNGEKQWNGLGWSDRGEKYTGPDALQIVEDMHKDGLSVSVKKLC